MAGGALPDSISTSTTEAQIVLPDVGQRSNELLEQLEACSLDPAWTRDRAQEWWREKAEA